MSIITSFKNFALKSLSKAKKGHKHYFTSTFQCGTFMAFKGKTNNNINVYVHVLSAYVWIIKFLLIISYMYHTHAMIHIHVL